MKKSLGSLPSPLILEICHFLNFISLYFVTLVDQNLFHILTSSFHARLIDQMIQRMLIEEFPYLKGMVLSDMLEPQSQKSPRYRVFQRLKTLMKRYYEHFPVKTTRQREEKIFRIQFNMVMGLDSTHLIKSKIIFQPSRPLISSCREITRVTI